MDYQWEKVETTLTQVLDSDKRLAQYNNRIYLLGGYKSPSLDSKTVFMFDPATGIWESKAPVPRDVAAIAICLNNKIYLVAGQSRNQSIKDVYAYTPETDMWEQKNDYPLDVAGNAVITHKNRLYSFGGFKYVSGSMAATANCYVYLEEEDSWLRLKDMPAALIFLDSISYKDHIYIIGGAKATSGGGGNPTNIFWRYDINADIWEDYGVLPDKLKGAFFVGSGDKIFSIGGQDPYTAHIYSFTMGQWEQIANKNFNRGRPIIVNNELYTFSGYYGIPFAIEKLIIGPPTNKFTISQQYQLGDGTPIQADDSVTLDAGEAYNQTAPKLAGFSRIGHKLDDGALNSHWIAKIDNVSADHTVTFVYALGDEPIPPIEYTITQEYQDVNGVSRRPDDTIQAIQGTSYTYNAPGINGYVCAGYKIDGGSLYLGSLAKILEVQDNHTVTFIYVPETPEGDEEFIITQEYRTNDGTTIYTTDYEKAKRGNTYRKVAPIFSGYSRVGYKIDSGDLIFGGTAIIPNVGQDYTVTFVYASGNEGGGTGENCGRCNCVKSSCCHKGKHFAMNIEVCGYEEPEEITAAINAAFDARK